MIILGLTGSIGMGKSTTAEMFRETGVPVHDADGTVHALYSGAATPLIEAAFPGTTHKGTVDRQALSARVFGAPDQMKKLEAIIHPLVSAERDEFLARQRALGAKIAVLDIPLLFETGADRIVDQIVVVSAPESVQKQRVLARPHMDEARFAAILSKQLPDREKRARAHYVIETGAGLDIARAQVHALLNHLNQSS